MRCGAVAGRCQLRRLHLSVFPTQYSDTFYREAHQAEARPLTRLAYHNDVLIGAVCARIDAAAGLTADTHLRRLYIMTLGVLAPYRRHGIGTTHSTHPVPCQPSHMRTWTHHTCTALVAHCCAAVSVRVCHACVCVLAALGRRLLQAILDFAQGSSEVGEVFLHVQTSNREALQFYEQFGFAVTGSIPNYYKRLQPPDCFIVAKQIKH